MTTPSADILAQLQLVQQNLQQLLMQKQQLQRSLAEADSAWGQLQTTPKAYRIVGALMVEAQKEVLAKELTEKKELFSLRLQSLDRQEELLKKKTEELQKKADTQLRGKTNE